MMDPKGRPNAVPWPPLILVASLAIGLGLEHLLPLSFWLLPFQPVVGGLVALVGASLDVWAMASLRAGRTTVLPHRASSHLVVKGPYSLSRNPIYLGNIILIFGIAVGIGSLWLVLTALTGAAATQKLAIEPEERHLRALFGTEFENYCSRVRRWL